MTDESLRVHLHRGEGAPPLHAQVADFLRQCIRRGQLGPGEKLPAEMELAERMGVSRIPVRQALQGLAREGVIRRRHGHGTFVAEDIKPPEAVHLEGIVGWRSDVGSSYRVLAAGPVIPPADVARFFGLPPDGELNRFERLRCRGDSPFVHVLNYLRPGDARGMRGTDFARRTMLELLRMRRKPPLGRMRQTIEAVGAHPVAALHLGIAAGSPSLSVQTLVWRRDGVPLLWSRASYRAEETSYVIEAQG